MDVFVGRITSTGFSTGDRIVIGDWRESPLGSFTNVMWAKPDGSRILLSPSERHAEYVSELYNFEDVEVTEITVERGRRKVSINGSVMIDIRARVSSTTFSISRLRRKRLPAENTTNGGIL